MSILQYKRILWVDDTVFDFAPFVGALYVEGANITHAQTLFEAKVEIEKNKFDLVVLDIRLPLGMSANSHLTEFDIVAAKGGFESGLVLAQWIKKYHPSLLIAGFSINDSTSEAAQWFYKKGFRYMQKRAGLRVSEFVGFMKAVFEGQQGKRKLRSFIVHGWDENTTYKLKNYIQNTLQLEEPIILHEQPSLGRTIIEKFEEVTDNIDLVFVLLTPDDTVYNSSTTNDVKRRARQNVIFEMGYFFAKMQRKNGAIILLYKGELELPSDIQGIVYIDIGAGIEAAGERIRKELDGII
jgi:CheY-like chemotaxis protein